MSATANEPTRATAVHRAAASGSAVVAVCGRATGRFTLNRCDVTCPECYRLELEPHVNRVLAHP
jgi:hypothetical protein